MWGFTLTSNFWYFASKDQHVLERKNWQSVRCTGCYFVWLVLILKPKPTTNKCNRVSACLCVIDGEGSWVFASRALVVVYLTSDRYVWPVSMEHFCHLIICYAGLKNVLTWSWLCMWVHVHGLDWVIFDCFDLLCNKCTPVWTVLVCFVINVIQFGSWYNHNGWQGVALINHNGLTWHQVTYLEKSVQPLITDLGWSEHIVMTVLCSVTLVLTGNLYI